MNNLCSKTIMQITYINMGNVDVCSVKKSDHKYIYSMTHLYF